MNESLINADIFFFITTIVVAVVGILLAVAIIYFIKILRDIDKFQQKVSAGTGDLIEDLKTVKNEIASVAKGGGAIYLLRVFVRLIGRTRRRIRRFK
jgi:hypothetical protein